VELKGDGARFNTLMMHVTRNARGGYLGTYHFAVAV
jgi:hypothetical protein